MSASPPPSDPDRRPGGWNGAVGWGLLLVLALGLLALRLLGGGC